MKKIIILSILICFSSTLLIAHGGRTDAYGGHNNRRTGGYHYHNSGTKHDANNPYQNHQTCGVCVQRASTAPQVETTTIFTDEETVIKIQAFLLITDYYKGKITGVLNNATKTAIKKYQKDNDLDQTGRIDTKTKKNIEDRINRIK